MKTQNILHADVLDIIFEGRNKSYGAYELRKSYNKRMHAALTIMVVCCLLLYAGYRLAGLNRLDTTTIIAGPDVHLIEVPAEKENVEPITPPPTKQEPLTAVRQEVLSTPVIVDEALPDEMPPTQEDLSKAKIGLTKIEGEAYDEIIAPPMEGINKGVISLPQKKADNADSIFTKVEIESQYPGGYTAWARFLHRKLQYPDEAVEKGIQGKVEIQFIVDTEGRVSDVQVVSGPPELREVAAQVIKRSGNWIPAEQNGRKVKSYKRQPITFSLGME